MTLSWAKDRCGMRILTNISQNIAIIILRSLIPVRPNGIMFTSMILYLLLSITVISGCVNERLRANKAKVTEPTEKDQKGFKVLSNLGRRCFIRRAGRATAIERICSRELPLSQYLSLRVFYEALAYRSSRRGDSSQHQYCHS